MEEVLSEDCFLLCSDGLCGVLSDDEIRDVLLSNLGDLSRTCSSLIESANAAGGIDNITVVLVTIQSE